MQYVVFIYNKSLENVKYDNKPKNSYFTNYKNFFTKTSLSKILKHSNFKIGQYPLEISKASKYPNNHYVFKTYKLLELPYIIFSKKEDVLYFRMVYQTHFPNIEIYDILEVEDYQAFIDEISKIIEIMEKIHKRNTQIIDEIKMLLNAYDSIKKLNKFGYKYDFFISKNVKTQKSITYYVEQLYDDIKKTYDIARDEFKENVKNVSKILEKGGFQSKNISEQPKLDIKEYISYGCIYIFQGHTSELLATYIDDVIEYIKSFINFKDRDLDLLLETYKKAPYSFLCSHMTNNPFEDYKYNDFFREKSLKDRKNFLFKQYFLCR